MDTTRPVKVTNSVLHKIHSIFQLKKNTIGLEVHQSANTCGAPITRSSLQIGQIFGFCAKNLFADTKTAIRAAEGSILKTRSETHQTYGKRQFFVISTKFRRRKHLAHRLKSTAEHHDWSGRRPNFKNWTRDPQTRRTAKETPNTKKDNFFCEILTF